MEGFRQKQQRPSVLRQVSQTASRKQHGIFLEILLSVFFWIKLCSWFYRHNHSCKSFPLPNKDFRMNFELFTCEWMWCSIFCGLYLQQIKPVLLLYSPRAFRKHCNHLSLQGRAGYKPSSPLLFTSNGLLSQTKPSPLVTTDKRWSEAELHWSQTSWWVIFFICIWVTNVVGDLIHSHAKTKTILCYAHMHLYANPN